MNTTTKALHDDELHRRVSNLSGKSGQLLANYWKSEQGQRTLEQEFPGLLKYWNNEQNRQPINEFGIGAKRLMGHVGTNYFQQK
jgi:hypothetical protein